MKTNVANKNTRRTHEGAVASAITPEQELRRTVMACMLFEDNFYESGVSVAARIAELVPKVRPEIVADIAIEAREKMKLRHVPLWIVRIMATLPNHKEYVADTLERVIQRADELAEYVALYWKEKRQPLSAQSKKGLARAFQKFSEYDLAKYNRDGAVKLRDVLFLSHAEPKDKAQAGLWKRLVNKELNPPETWEVLLSAGADKTETWTRLIQEGKLGALALLRNLRNMNNAGVPKNVIRQGLAVMKTERVLPFRFISAARYAPDLEPELEAAMFRSLTGVERLSGKTTLLVDVSGSMNATVSGKSEISRLDAASALAMLLREICEEVEVITFSNKAVLVPSRRGFALRDAIDRSQEHGGTNTQDGINAANTRGYDRLIVITDEQSHQSISGVPESVDAYFVNVASHQNGIGYGSYVHIDGWSESIVEYIRAYES